MTSMTFIALFRMSILLVKQGNRLSDDDVRELIQMLQELEMF